MVPPPGQNPQLLSSARGGFAGHGVGVGEPAPWRPEKRVTARSQAPKKKWTGLHFPRKRARNTCKT